MFNKQNFCHVASNNRNEQKAGLFVYKTTDDLATVTASGYFNEKIIDINLHDLIVHEWHDPSDKTKVQQNLLCVTERTLDNVGTSVVKSKWEGDVDQFIQSLGTDFVKLDGTSVMTAPLKFEAGSMRGAVGPYLNGVSFWKMDSQYAITNIANFTDSQFFPVTTNSIDIGRSANKWKDLYLSGKVYVATLNNSYDISVPTYAGTMVVADFTSATAGQVLALDSNLKPIWQNAPTIPTVGDGTITITQGGTTKGTFTTNQSGNTTIDLDAGGSATWGDIDGNINDQSDLISLLNTKTNKGHEIIDFQAPTALNNYTWYRLYADGWIEQGGYVASGGGTISVTLPVTMADANYQIMLTGKHNSTTAGSTTSVSTNSYPVTTTGFYVNNYIENGGTRADGDAFWWQVSGMADTSQVYSYETPGTYTVELPAGTYLFEMSAGGGGGAAATANLNANHAGGATGGSGAYGSFSLTLAQADTFTIVVGNGGAGAKKQEGTATGGSGGTTSISSTDLGNFVSLSGGTGGQAHATGNGDWMIAGLAGTVTTTLATHNLSNGSAGSGTTAEGAAYSGGPITNPSPYDNYGFGGTYLYQGGSSHTMVGGAGGDGFVMIIKQ